MKDTKTTEQRKVDIEDQSSRSTLESIFSALFN